MTTYTHATKASVTVLRGPAGCGKTSGLVERIGKAIAAKGDSPAPDPERNRPRALVLAPRETAADELARRIGSKLGTEALESVRVTTPRRLALEVLASPDAVCATGRRARMMSDVEYQFFLEDLLVTGKRPKRLREMMKFFERGWSELREDDGDWLVTGEEEELERLAKDNLDSMQALHPAEVAAACVRYLAGSAKALAEAAYPCVFVDDARSMSRSSQILACMLASDELTLTWDPNAALRGEEPYNYELGLSELLAENPSAQVIELDACHASQAVQGVLRNLLTRPFMKDAPSVEILHDARPSDDDGVASNPRMVSALTRTVASSTDGGMVVPSSAEDASAAAQGEFRVQVAPYLSDEMPQVVAMVRDALVRAQAAGAPAESAAEQVFVAVPNDAWALRVCAALGQSSIPVSPVLARQRIGGDIRDLSKSRAAQVAEALALVADPADSLAWRCWCGFGDYLAHSREVDWLAKDARCAGRTLADEFFALDEGELEGVPESEGFGRLAQRCRSARDLIEEARGLRGEELLARACEAALGTRDLPEELRLLLDDVRPGEDAAALVARLEDALIAPRFAPACVRVGNLEALLGQAPRTIVFAGMVNGLIPAHAMFDLTEAMADEQDRMREKLVRRLYAAAGTARETIACSSFECATVEQSERLHLDTTRVRLAKEGRVCDISPSVCIAYMSGTEAIR